VVVANAIEEAAQIAARVEHRWMILIFPHLARGLVWDDLEGSGLATRAFRYLQSVARDRLLRKVRCSAGRLRVEPTTVKIGWLVETLRKRRDSTQLIGATWTSTL